MDMFNKLWEYFQRFFYKFQYLSCSIKTFHIHPSVVLGKGSIIRKNVVIQSGVVGGERFQVFENVFVDQNVKLGKDVILYENVLIGPNIHIGDYTTINRYTTIDCGYVKNFTSIGPFCHIGAGKHAIDFISTCQALYGKNNICHLSIPYDSFDSPPIIGHDVWIGSHVVVMQGVSIGDGAIIGSGAIVTKDIPPYSIVGGVPAKLIRMRFDKDRIEYLQQLNLWENYEKNMEMIKTLLAEGNNWSVR